ncbi:MULTISPECIES: AAA family ATPase [unclassified Leuconostoc]|uniref:AAA family ATPase n=1 Tax=unclassified Leuconostoc TaxID=2685106 RepID=UPI00190566D9|nr:MULTISPECIES: AAA family ATPase [unclassified Leuconostoc]MBK0040781.1 ATP-dependent Clp protease ATP-binding subunit [Leuconostoc sp. S51]MBK0051797.1 ATP-dependent Clp protease ATP-binding subunit [Leuconostoc sp. S50]
MSEETYSETPYIDRYTVNISQIVQANPSQHVAYNRDAEMERLWTSLNKVTLNSPLLIGPFGVGKTQLVEALALKMLEQDNAWHDRQIIQISLANLMSITDGETYDYKFQQIITELTTHADQYVGFIDEIHQINAGDYQAAGQIIKPALSRDKLQIIGATTTEEFHQYIEGDGALMSRFDLIAIPELSVLQTVNIIHQIKPKFSQDYDLVLPDELDQRVVELSVRYIPDQFLPRKAISLYDSATAYAKIHGDHELTMRHLAHILAFDFNIPERITISSADERLERLADNMKAQVIGQDEAIDDMVDLIIEKAAGLRNDKTPVSMILAGTPGVGKTESARALARYYFGTEKNLLRFDMSEYKQLDQSYAMFQQRLTQQVRHSPYSVVLLDEIEKADPEILDLLLQVMDYGHLSNKAGRGVNFADVLILMTTNAGSKAVINLFDKSQEYLNDNRRMDNFNTTFELALINAGMRAEFISRTNKIIIFHILTMPEMVKITDLKLNQVNKRLQKQGFNLVWQSEDVSHYIDTFDLGFEWTDDNKQLPVHPIAEYIADVGYKPSRGVRSLDATINKYITAPLGRIILQARKKPTVQTVFVFRALGEAPTKTSPYGSWKPIFNQLSPLKNEKGELNDI